MMEYDDDELAKFPRGPLPRTSPASWIEYPSVAMMNELEGRLHFQVMIDPYGEVAECEVIESSGVASFDRRACSAIMANARFYPAMDANQEPVRSTYQSMVVFKLLEAEPVNLTAWIARDGTIEGCDNADPWLLAQIANSDLIPFCAAAREDMIERSAGKVLRLPYGRVPMALELDRAVDLLALSAEER